MSEETFTESDQALERARLKFKDEGWRYGGVRPCNAFGRPCHSVFFYKGEMCDGAVIVRRIPLSICRRRFHAKRRETTAIAPLR